MVHSMHSHNWIKYVLRDYLHFIALMQKIRSKRMNRNMSEETLEIGRNQKVCVPWFFSTSSTLSQTPPSSHEKSRIASIRGQYSRQQVCSVYFILQLLVSFYCSKCQLNINLFLSYSKVSKSSLDLILSPLPSVKIRIMGGKVYLR